LKKRHDSGQRNLRRVSIHLGRILTVLDPLLALSFCLLHSVAQEAQRCELR